MNHPYPRKDQGELDAILETVSRIELCLDFDGTLVPIVDDPTAVELAQETRKSLLTLSEHPRVHVAIVSGRAVADIRERVDIDGIAYAGNHGLEIHDHDGYWIHPAVEEIRPRLEAIRDAIDISLDHIPGYHLEDKFATMTVHYRTVPEGYVQTVVDTVREYVRWEDGIRLEQGKAVLQLRPAISWDKGDAILQICEDNGQNRLVIFMGDDDTDADGFRAVHQLDGHGYTVAVGEKSLPSRDTLPDPQAVQRWLQWFSRLI